ncbi:hypothetical protein L1887_02903 [Cichorium endivia]|nr:hypothetical protein L1887_02903 [Cichorium endivia]
MGSNSLPTLSEAHPETMDLLSRAWCDFAVKEARHEPEFQNQALVLHEYSISSFDDGSTSPNILKLESIKMDDTSKSLPPWKTNDVKSWIWMQQAMHPELNYSSCFRKKWQPWQINPFKSSQLSIKKWLKEIKRKRKENERLQNAEVHAAISVAGVAAALAAIAAQNSRNDGSNSITTTKEAAVATAAALVAAQCAKTAEAMGAKRQQISTVMSSAMTATTASDILTLAAAASTSIRGATTLKTRSACKMLNTNVPVLPIEENTDPGFDFEQCRLILKRGSELGIRTSDGRCIVRSVSVVLNHEAKAILRTRKLNLLNAFASKKESVVLDQHVELYKNSEDGRDPCFLIVLTTTRGIVKLDMIDDDECYKIWAWTINRMLSLATSFTKYSLPCLKN